MSVSRMTTVGLGAALLAGCVPHILPHEPKVRDYQSDNYAASDDQRSAGSLWSGGSSGLFADVRAQRVGDILTVRIDERADATRDASTSSSRQNQMSAGVSSFFNAVQKLARTNPDLDLGSLIGLSSSADFDASGATSRSGQLRGVLPVRIKRRLPNGDFFVEGRKVVLINDEESHLYLSGVVRPLDVAPDNTVLSARLADVELEYTGRGVISERQSLGWFSRLLGYLWPF